MPMQIKEPRGRVRAQTDVCCEFLTVDICLHQFLKRDNVSSLGASELSISAQFTQIYEMARLFLASVFLTHPFSVL